MIVIAMSFASLPALGQTPKVGRKAASKYFQKDVEPDRNVAAVDVSEGGRGAGGNVLMLHLGGYTNSDAYQWGCDCKQKSS